MKERWEVCLYECMKVSVTAWLQCRHFLFGGLKLNLFLVTAFGWNQCVRDTSRAILFMSKVSPKGAPYFSSLRAVFYYRKYVCLFYILNCGNQNLTETYLRSQLNWPTWSGCFLGLLVTYSMSLHYGIASPLFCYLCTMCYIYWYHLIWCPQIPPYLETYLCVSNTDTSKKKEKKEKNRGQYTKQYMWLWRRWSWCALDFPVLYYGPRIVIISCHTGIGIDCIVPIFSAIPIPIPIPKGRNR